MAKQNEELNNVHGEQVALKPVAPTLSLEEHVRWCLWESSKNLLLGVKGVSLLTLKHLHDAGIRTMLDLDEHSTISSIDTEQWNLVQQYCEGLKTRFAAEYNAGFFNHRFARRIPKS